MVLVRLKKLSPSPLSFVPVCRVAGSILVNGMATQRMLASQEETMSQIVTCHSRRRSISAAATAMQPALAYANTRRPVVAAQMVAAEVEAARSVVFALVERPATASLAM